MGTNTYGYAYVPIGNRQLSTVAGVGAPGSAVTNLYASTPLNQYTNITREGESPDEPQYDLDGNMITNGSWTYTWNGEVVLWVM